MKTYIKHSDTCGCVYLQTFDPETGEWGSVETYKAPNGQHFHSMRCEAHAEIPFGDLNTVLIDECRARNLTVKSLLENEMLAGPAVEWEKLTAKEAEAERERLNQITVDLMACCTFEGAGAERKAIFKVPLTKAECEAEAAKLETKAASEQEAITEEYVARVEFR